MSCLCVAVQVNAEESIVLLAFHLKAGIWPGILYMVSLLFDSISAR